jgi:hypothetical protein
MDSDFRNFIWCALFEFIVMTSTSISRLTSSPWLHLFGGPILWMLHFLISYLWIEFACRMNFFLFRSTFLGLTLLSWIFLVFTFAVTFAALYVGWLSYRNWQLLKKKRPKAESSTAWEVDSRRFMSISGIALSGLFSLVILLSSLPVLALNPCLL